MHTLVGTLHCYKKTRHAIIPVRELDVRGHECSAVELLRIGKRDDFSQYTSPGGVQL
jgi:hypothetical protein